MGEKKGGGGDAPRGNSEDEIGEWGRVDKDVRANALEIRLHTGVEHGPKPL